MLAAARTTLLRAVVAFFPVSDVGDLERVTPYQSVRDYVNHVCRPQTLRKSPRSRMPDRSMRRYC